MDKKKFYEAPSIEVLWLTSQVSILAASDLGGEFDDEMSLDGFDDYDE